MTYSIGIDLGGTKIEITAFDHNTGDELLKRRVATPDNYTQMIEQVGELVEWADGRLGKSNQTIGIGMPGSKVPSCNRWRNCKRQYCNGKNVEQDLIDRLQRKVIIENDANCFAIAEAFQGVAKDYRVVYALTLGTGLGGALVIDKKLHHGLNRMGGESGHIPLPWMQDANIPLLKCHCGRVGCAEQYISGTGFENDYYRLAGKSLKAQEIILLRDEQEPHALTAYTNLIDRFSRFIAVIHSVIDPDVIVIGGGLSNIKGFIEDINKRVLDYMVSSYDRVNLLKAHFGDSSGARGAAMLAEL